MQEVRGGQILVSFLSLSHDDSLPNWRQLLHADID
jgi:hypothetical protein